MVRVGQSSERGIGRVNSIGRGRMIGIKRVKGTWKGRVTGTEAINVEDRLGVREKSH